MKRLRKLWQDSPNESYRGQGYRIVAIANYLHVKSVRYKFPNSNPISMSPLQLSKFILHLSR